MMPITDKITDKNTDKNYELFYRIEQLNQFIYEFRVKKEIKIEDYEERLIDIYNGFKEVANKINAEE